MIIMTEQEQEIVDYYENVTHNIEEISKEFNKDNATVRNIMTRYWNRIHKGEVKGW